MEARPEVSPKGGKEQRGEEKQQPNDTEQLRGPLKGEVETEGTNARQRQSVP